MRSALGIFALALSIAGVACASAVVDVPAQGAIVVTVLDIRIDQGGSIVAGLFKGKDGWLDLNKALLKKTLKAASDSLAVVFDGVPYDSTYAVEVIHDKNENGKLDFRKFPYPRPTEGAGVSNNKFRMGPPDYEKARFALSAASTSVRIKMRY